MYKFVNLACVSLMLTPAISFAEDIHLEVEKALKYTLPAMSCDKPELPGASKDVVDPATGNVQRADIDSYTLGRFERAEKRWKKCLTKYKAALMDDFERLKNSASYGLTQTQATTIMGNMKRIQSAVVSPTGEPDPPTP